MNCTVHIGSLKEPLLRRKREQAVSNTAHDSFWPCAINLSKVITGAGMMAIPRAFVQVGWLPGSVMLVGVALLTFFTLSVLVQGSSISRASTYGELVLATCGRTMMRLLQLAVLLFCFGFSVVYLVVIRDILLGSPPDCNGLLCEAFGPSANIDARWLMVAVAVVVCAPLLLLRSMDKLAALNAAGVAASVLLGCVAAALAAVAAATGQAHAVPMTPQWDVLGHTRGQQLEALTDVVPVILACYVAHQSLHPLMPLLQPYTQARMLKVVAVALTISCSNFLLLSVGAAVAFGPDTDVNVLNNFSSHSLQPLLGWQLAVITSWVVRGGYLLCILATLLLYMHPLRSCLAQMLWPQHSTAAVAGAHDAGERCVAQALDVADVREAAAAVDLPTADGSCRQCKCAGCCEGCACCSQSSYGSCGGGGRAGSGVPCCCCCCTVQVSKAVDEAPAAPGVPGHVTSQAAAWASPGMPATHSCQAATAAAAAHGSAGCGCSGSGGCQTATSAPFKDSVAVAPAASAQCCVQQQQQDMEQEMLAQQQLQDMYRPWQGDEQQQQQQQQGCPAAPPQQCPHWQEREQVLYYPLTYGLLAGMVLAAVLVTNIYQAVSAVGDIASTLQAFIIPGAVAIALVAQQRRLRRRVAEHMPPLLCAADVESWGEQDASVEEAAGGPAAGTGSVLYAATGAAVLLLGLALFSNGVYERVSVFL